MPFNMDFGPLNLAMVHRYSRELARLLQVSKMTHFIYSDLNGQILLNFWFYRTATTRTIKSFTTVQIDMIN